MCPIDEGKVREWTLAAVLIEKSMRNCCNHCSEFNKERGTEGCRQLLPIT